MAFLDNIKISVKIISAVILLAMVSAGLTIFSGMTMQSSGQRILATCWKATLRARVELARVTRRVAELGYYALAVTTYAPDSPDAKKHASETRSRLQAGHVGISPTPRNSARTARPSSTNSRSASPSCGSSPPVSPTAICRRETTSATEVKRLNETLPLVADELRNFNQQLSKEMATAMASVSASADWSLMLVYVSSAVAILLSVLLAL